MYITWGGQGTIALLCTSLLAVLLSLSIVVLVESPGCSSGLGGGRLMTLVHSIATGYLAIPTAFGSGGLVKGGGALREGLGHST